MEVTFDGGKVITAHLNGHIIKTDQFQLPSDFPEKYKAAVINSAELCAVKKTINNPPKFEIITTIK